METIKSAIGMGSSQQEGQEPVSGETGSGSAVAPYDMGNADDKDLGGKAPQDTATTSSPVANMSAPDTNLTGTSNPPPTNTTASQPSEPSAASKPAEKPTIGSASWFATAIPGMSKEASDQRQQQQQQQVSNDEARGPEPARSAQPTTKGESQQATANVATTDLPPNQIGGDPPKGNSTDLDTSVYPPSRVRTNESANAGTQNDNDAIASSSSSPSSAKGPANRELRGSKAFAPTVDRPAESNSHKREGSIPTAGGVPIGQAAFEQRRASADIRRKSQISATGAAAASSSTPAPAVATESAAPSAPAPAPAPVESAPVAGSTPAPPHEPAVPAPAGDPDSVAPDDTRDVPAHEPPPPSTSVPKPEPVSTNAAKTEDSAKGDGKEGRRGSLFDKLKNKLKA